MEIKLTDEKEEVQILDAILSSIKDDISISYDNIPDNIKENEKQLINYLAEDKIIQLVAIKEFITKYSTIKPNIRNKAITFLETLEQWSYTTISTEDGIFSSIEKESALSNIEYLKNTIYEFTTIF